jgi:ABC-type phosphate transport system substrate-binding protein
VSWFWYKNTNDIGLSRKYMMYVYQKYKKNDVLTTIFQFLWIVKPHQPYTSCDGASSEL